MRGRVVKPLFGGAVATLLVALSASAQSAPGGPGVEVRADGTVATTGIFVPFSHVGLVDVSQESATDDTRASEARTSVANRAADAFNPKAVAVANSRVEGITHLAVVPRQAGNIFAGTGLVATTDGGFDSVVAEEAFIYAQLGESGARAAGGSRAAAIAQLRAALREAGGETEGEREADDALLRPEDAALLARAATGELPLVVAVERAADLMQLVRLKRARPELDLIALGAAEGWQVADALAGAGVKVMIDPHDNLPDGFDSVGARIDNALILDRAGVDYAFTTASADLTHNVRVLPQHAGNAVGEGLAWPKAWAAITTTPARWFGVDLSDTQVVWDGDPLEVTSRPVSVRIGGEAVPLRSRQIALRERYLPNPEDARAHKYR